MNEELQTVNAELKSKLEIDRRGPQRPREPRRPRPTSARCSSIPSCASACSRRAVAKLFNVTEADIGRPITDFTHHLDYEALADDAQRVLRDLDADRARGRDPRRTLADDAAPALPDHRQPHRRRRRDLRRHHRAAPGGRADPRERGGVSGAVRDDERGAAVRRGADRRRPAPPSTCATAAPTRRRAPWSAPPPPAAGSPRSRPASSRTGGRSRRGCSRPARASATRSPPSPSRSGSTRCSGRCAPATPGSRSCSATSPSGGAPRRSFARRATRWRSPREASSLGWGSWDLETGAAEWDARGREIIGLGDEETHHRRLDGASGARGPAAARGRDPRPRQRGAARSTSSTP